MKIVVIELRIPQGMPTYFHIKTNIALGVVVPSDEIQRNSYIDSEIGFVTSYIYIRVCFLANV